MNKILISKFIKEEKGAPIIEIVILIAMSAIIAAFLFPTLRTNLGLWFNEMVNNVSKGIGGGSGLSTPVDPVETGTAGAGGAWGNGN